jgi:hypothetical protein
MDACKWFVDDSDQTNDSLHVIGINRYDLGLSPCRKFHAFVDVDSSDFPNTKSPSKMRIEHGNSFFTQSEQIIKFDSVEEQRQFWDNMMSNLMTPEEIELLHRVELEPNINEETPKVEKNEDGIAHDNQPTLEKSNVESSNDIKLEIGRIADLYAIDVVTKMINSLDKIRNSNAITSLEAQAVSLWTEYIDKYGKK